MFGGVAAREPAVEVAAWEVVGGHVDAHGFVGSWVGGMVEAVVVRMLGDDPRAGSGQGGVERSRWLPVGWRLVLVKGCDC